MYFRKLISLQLIIVALFAFSSCDQTQSRKTGSEKINTGSVIFIHPDGSGLNMWNAMRLIKTGPDVYTSWDKMDNLGIYRSHQLDCITTSSHAGATVHAYGIKVPYNTYGNNPEKPIKSVSGKDYSIMMEAMKQGMATALINSGHICEPGTGVFAASSNSRNNTDEIAEQIIKSGVEIILSGGEIYLLPKGEMGVHGEEGRRKDGVNLIEVAKSLGYAVVYNRDEMLALPAETEKVLGVFAAKHTFNDLPEEDLREKGLLSYEADAPTIGEMTRFALQLLEYKQKPFILVVEEEGSDNFSNDNNANGALTALSRADDAIGEALKYIELYPNTMLITAADSDAGGMQVETFGNKINPDIPLPAFNDNGAPIDGMDGTETMPFKTKADRQGNEHPFCITWASDHDVYGTVIVKIHGLNSEYLPNNVDNSDIYKLMYLTLFGKNFLE